MKATDWPAEVDFVRGQEHRRPTMSVPPRRLVSMKGWASLETSPAKIQSPARSINPRCHDSSRAAGWLLRQCEAFWFWASDLSAPANHGNCASKKRIASAAVSTRDAVRDRATGGSACHQRPCGRAGCGHRSGLPRRPGGAVDPGICQKGYEDFRSWCLLTPHIDRFDGLPQSSREKRAELPIFRCSWPPVSRIESMPVNGS